ncbi:hypothetical protein J0S82_006267, partial [Galemys pyrenaicus]
THFPLHLHISNICQEQRPHLCTPGKHAVSPHESTGSLTHPQEKKCLKKAGCEAPASPENSRSTPEECEETSEKAKKNKKTKTPEDSVGEWNERLICLLLQTQAKGNFFQGGVEETAGGENLPERKTSFSKERALSDQEKAGNKVLSKKMRMLSSKEEPLISGSEEAAGSEQQLQEKE